MIILNYYFYLDCMIVVPCDSVSFMFVCLPMGDGDLTLTREESARGGVIVFGHWKGVA